MQPQERRAFLRRISFMWGSATLAACGGGSGEALSAGPGSGTLPPAPTPAPVDPLPAVVPPAPAPPAPASGVVAAADVGRMEFYLGSDSTATLRAFCLGQPFAMGDVPAGREIQCGLAHFQASVMNRWPDGSAKFAVLAGRASAAAGAKNTWQLTAGDSAMAPAVLTEQQLLQSGVSATIRFEPYGSVDLEPLIGIASQFDPAQKRWKPGRVRQILAGSEMSSWLYYSRFGTHPHLTAWFEVRYWADGQVQVLPWVENGLLNVAGPTSYAGTLEFSLNGVNRFTAAVDIAHHCRTAALSGDSQGYWGDGSPPLRYAHNAPYLQHTGLVPTYWAQIPAASNLLKNLVSGFSPFVRGSFPSSMGSAGYHQSIGLLPEWDVAYLASGADLRAQTAVVVHGLAAGRYAIHYRDEITNQPLRFSSYPDLCLGGGNVGVSDRGDSSTRALTPASSGTNPPNWANSHHPSVGFLAYLVSGWFYFAEETQFAATLGYLKQANMVRGRSQGILVTNAGANTTRGAAWALRTLAQAATATPDVDAGLREELLRCIESNVDYYFSKHLGQPNNAMGVCTPYNDYTNGDNKYRHAMWMEDFLTAAWGCITSLKFALPAPTLVKLDTFFRWKAQSVVGRLGRAGVATEYHYCDAAQYTMAVAPSDTADFIRGTGPWYANWGEIYNATLEKPNVALPEDRLRGAYFPDATSYWGNMQPAIAYAAQLAVPGSAEAYLRMVTAPNWKDFVASCNAYPVWSVRPPSAL